MDKVFVCCTFTLLGLVAASSGKVVSVGMGPLHVLAKCSSESSAGGLINCAAEKMLRSLEKISEQPSVEILPGISVVNDGTENNRMAKQLPAELPSNPKEKMTKLMDLIVDAMSRMISGKTLKIKLPSSESIARTLEEGNLLGYSDPEKTKPGRGKNKNKMSNSYFMMGSLLLTLIVPVVLGGLGLFTTKAIIIAKIALVVSVISFIQYFFRTGSLFSGYGGGYGVSTQSTYGVPVYGGGTNNLGPGLYQRSFQEGDAKDAHDMAYSAHK